MGRTRLAHGLVLTAVLVASCMVYRTPTLSDLPKPGARDSLLIQSPVRAHLLNGETALFEAGAIVVRDTLRAITAGTGHRYSLTLVDAGLAGGIPLDSVFGMEVVRDRVDGVTSTFLTLLAVTAVAIPAAVAIACISNPKCFGSCPTVYSDSAGTPVLEAEGFSYSIAPLFEAPDLDRLRAQPDSTGTLQLEVRNEAYETHYINRMGLVEVRHGPGEQVFPGGGVPLVTSDFTVPVSARDRTGRDVLAELASADGRTYRTAPQVLANATAADYRDVIDLTFPSSQTRGDTAAVVFRMRNSLLNTVLLYELMLGDPGLRSLDWIGKDLSQIGPAARLGRWYVDHMGMRVSVWDGTEYRPVARVADTGPVAWNDIAVRVPVLTSDSVRVRLSFVADDWRIDQIRLARRVRAPHARTITPTEVITGGQTDTSTLGSLMFADQRYAVTTPGQRFFVRFAVGAAPGDSARTFLLASQGYYIEWLRGDWLRTEHLASTFDATDAALVSALHRWSAEQSDLEKRFAATRVPVR